MTRGVYARPTATEKFWLRVETSPAGCWLWTGTMNYAGYGVMKTAGVQVRIHRFAYELLVGPIPEGLEACHTCDVRHCARPEHLFLGTTQDNTADRVAKGRSVQGERQHSARLTAEQVRQARRLRASGLTQAAIAQRFGVGRSTIVAVTTGKSWKGIA